ncbi:MAG TPA: GntR family transcriptional regulator [Anaerolineae bacterium]|nr:GntR family transcriptional regulator [Anaerolineae bacterium]HIP69963.1 GntR family transcriptional regulator [Anaerolineae bacterium]
MTTIERESPIPLYFQLKQILAERIDNGRWQPGDLLPTEMQLEEQYQVSRITVRRALKELELEGKISRFRGRGTIVAQPKISHSPEPHFSLTDALLRQGVQPGWEVLSAEWVAAPDEIAEQFEIEAGTPVYFLQRLRLVDGEPIGYHVAYAAPAAATAVDSSQLTAGGSLAYLGGSDILQGSYANRTLEAIPASAEVAALLGIEPGSPMLSIRRQVIGPDGRPIEILHAVYRGDRFQYQLHQEMER